MDSVFLLLLALGPVVAACLYDTGRAGRLPPHKKYFNGNANNQRTMKLVNERAVDSYFRISKSPPRNVAFATVEENHTAPPPRVRAHTEHDLGHATRPAAGIRNGDVGGMKPNANGNQISKRNNEDFFDPNQKEYLRNEKEYSANDINQNIHHKSRVDSYARGPSEASYRPAQASRSGHAAGVKDKALHKATLNTERNAQAMARALSDITRTLAGRAGGDREYRKRAAGRAGGAARQPYALFYRMSREQLAGDDADSLGGFSKAFTASDSGAQYTAFRDR